MNILGLQATEANRSRGKDKAAQQDVNLENHLWKAHGTSDFVCLRFVCPCVKCIACVCVAYCSPYL